MIAVEEIPSVLYDSFAARRFGGNVAGVVVVHPLPADLVMQAIAAEIGRANDGIRRCGTDGFADAPALHASLRDRRMRACEPRGRR
jgi:hypothetical protein